VKYNTKQLHSLLKQENRTFVVARDDVTNRIEGLTGCDLIDGKSLYLFKVSRRANASKRGVGSNIFEYLLNEYFSKYPAELHVHEDNIAAKNLYQKFGFQDSRSFRGEFTGKKIRKMVRPGPNFV
jgi:ribosomal protein S18 acetylase RimI-like enzyme